LIGGFFGVGLVKILCRICQSGYVDVVARDRSGCLVDFTLVCRPAMNARGELLEGRLNLFELGLHVH